MDGNLNSTLMYRKRFYGSNACTLSPAPATGFTRFCVEPRCLFAVCQLDPAAACHWLIMQTSNMTFSEYWQVIADPRVVASYKVTVGSALIASLFNGLFGLLLAWVLVRYTFPGKRILDALVDLPFALPTAVAGITLATLYSANGWIGSVLAELGIKVAYTPLGIIVAMAFTSIPFVVRTVQLC